MTPQDNKEVEVNPQSDAHLSDGGAQLASQFGNSPVPAMNMIYGGSLVLVALGGLIGLAFAYLPSTAEPSAQTAAAAETSEIVDVFADTNVGGKAAFVYDITKEKPLYAKNENLQLPLASITKIMLVLAVSEVLKPDDVVPITHTAVAKGGGGLTWGEEWLVKDLIDFTLITSSNTGAEALAEAADAKLLARYSSAPAGGAAVWRMNALAQELDLDETYFINASGLDESTTQAGALGSASDIARLFTYAIKNQSALFTGTTKSNVPLSPLNFPGRTATNTNNALADIPGIIMGKTGTTDLAGGNLAVAFNVSEGHPVVVVVLGGTIEGRFEDVKALVEKTRTALSAAN